MERMAAYEGTAMGLAFYQKHFHIWAHHRFWLIVTALVAFMLVVLWAQPAH